MYHHAQLGDIFGSHKHRGIITNTKWDGAKHPLMPEEPFLLQTKNSLAQLLVALHLSTLRLEGQDLRTNDLFAVNARTLVGEHVV
jgi:hypothetical protein